MDDQQVGTSLRSIRIRRRWTQQQLADTAGISRHVVGRVERGRAATVAVGALRAIGAALDARISVVIHWQGGDLPRLVNSRHSALHEAAARMFDGLDGWVVEPEVSFSIYGERGVIDLIAWHPGRRALLVIELKTELVDINDLMGSVDRKRRLAERIARDRGWAADTVSCWVVVADVRTNRRALGRHVTTLRSKFPADGRDIRNWLRSPNGPISALGFMGLSRSSGLTNGLAPIRRVRPRRPAA